MRKISICIAGYSIIHSFFSNIAVAANSNSDFGNGLSSDETATKLDTNITFDVIKVFLALAVVIVLLMFTVKWLSKRNRSWNSQRGIKTHGGVNLGQQTSVQVIELADRIYVVGVGENITLLDKEDDPDKIAAIIASMEQETTTTSFSTVKQWVTTITKKNKPSNNNNNNNNNSNELWNDSTNFEDLLQIKLDKQAERKQELESLLKDKK